MNEAASSKKTDKTINFWFCGGLLVVLLAAIMARDISRPFYGLHSWKEAAAAWRARCYLNYPLSYTKGLALWEVGQPPSEKPNRSLDHPQLGLFLPAIDLAIFGVDERGVRIGGVIRAVLSLLIFLKILRGLCDDKTTLLAGLFFVIFPITGYFGVRGWVTAASFGAIWYYLVIIGSVTNGPASKAYHKWILAVLLFLVLQLNWEGFFYAFAIGVHYVFRCIRRKEFPDKVLLTILIVAPLSSLILNFAVMAAGHSWDWEKIWILFKWRASKGEMPEFIWSKWFARLAEFAVLNFKLPALITAIAYLTLGQLFLLTAEKESPVQPKRFPQFWLFLMPAIFQLFILRGALWMHQYWESPLVPFLAIAAALGVMTLADFLAKMNRRLAVAGAVVLTGVIFVSCAAGLNHYHGIRWHSPEKINMFKTLNKNIPPDKALLSFEDFIVNQNTAKGPHYRPEFAWYLDRKITQARTISEVKSFARTGNYPYYLIPRAKNLMPLINQLSNSYKFQYFPTGQYMYMIFDLNTSARN